MSCRCKQATLSSTGVGFKCEWKAFDEWVCPSWPDLSPHHGVQHMNGKVMQCCPLWNTSPATC